jgi:hypothetical protein
MIAKSDRQNESSHSILSFASAGSVLSALSVRSVQAWRSRPRPQLD